MLGGKDAKVRVTAKSRADLGKDFVAGLLEEWAWRRPSR